MSKKRLAICDKDREYLSMMQAYLVKKNPAGFEIMVFDSIKEAKAASKEEPFEIVLVSEGIYDTSVRNINAQKIFILQENGLVGITGYSIVEKYQSVDRLMSQVLDAFALDEECRSIESKGRTPSKLISFYAPDRHKGQSIAALTVAQVFSDMGNKTLYISMQPFSGFEQLLGIKYEADITDFMYFVLKHSDKLLYKLEGIKRTIHGVDYLPPALDYSDLMKIEEDEWKRCFDALLYSSDYAYIVVDLTETCKGFYHLLERSDTSYILSGKDSLSSAMRTQFEQLMQKKELGAVLKKSVHFHLMKDWKEYPFNLEQLSVSQLGAYMKGVLTQNGQSINGI
ncbi:MAG: hypothetical protein K2N89_06950 [Lachnospiraceae bacterium]|nr:hypothetical protein [Lachnospiraceae bacterium]